MANEVRVKGGQGREVNCKESLMKVFASSRGDAADAVVQSEKRHFASNFAFCCSNAVATVDIPVI